MQPRHARLPSHSHAGPARLRWWVGLALLLTLALAACGAGDPTTPVTATPSRARQAAPGPGATRPPPLVAHEATLVNTQLEGQQVLRGLGATRDGGYTVVWMSGEAGSLFMRHFDREGQPAGPELALQLDPASAGGGISAVASGSVAVLADGGVVFAYPTLRVATGPGGQVLETAGLYVQRFDAAGALLAPEQALLTLDVGDPRRPATVGAVQALAMPDGGYLLGWGVFLPSATVGMVLSAYTTQYFDAQGRPVGAPAQVDMGSAINVLPRLQPDGLGGYTVYWSGQTPDFQPTGVTVAHFDATQTAMTALSGWQGEALLVALLDGRYVLYTRGADGAQRQFLDAAGQPEGPAVAVEAMPASALLLADGSFMLFWPADPAGALALRFDAQGAALGDTLGFASGAIRWLAAALDEGGFATAWSAPGAGGDMDVFTQRFTEPPSAARRACLGAARGLRGHARKAFLDGCLVTG